jgi:hypothetical protein
MTHGLETTRPDVRGASMSMVVISAKPEAARSRFNQAFCHGDLGAVRTAWTFIALMMVATSAKTESQSCGRNLGASFSGRSLRSCCAVQAAVGCSVIATWDDPSAVVRQDDEYE